MLGVRRDGRGGLCDVSRHLRNCRVVVVEQKTTPLVLRGRQIPVEQGGGEFCKRREEGRDRHVKTDAFSVGREGEEVGEKSVLRHGARLRKYT